MRWLSLFAVLLFGPVLPYHVSATELRSEGRYQHRVAPVLRKYCADCHTADSTAGRWMLDAYADHNARLLDQAGWRKVQQYVKHHIMPPPGELAPSRDERHAVVQWIEEAVFFVDPDRPDPGPAAMRRLNRNEYNRTVRDVLGFESSPADPFPADDSGYGFDNIAELLVLSPLHYEKYRSAAREIAAELTAFGPPPRVGVELRAEQLTLFSGKPTLDANRVLFRSMEDEVGTEVQIPVTSTYRVLARVATVPDSREGPLAIDVVCDGETVGRLNPTSTYRGKPGAQASVFALVRLPAGQRRIALRLRAEPAAQPSREVLGTIGFMGLAGPMTPVPPSTSEFLSRYGPQRGIGLPILRLSGEDLDHGSGSNSLDTGRAWFTTEGYRHTPLLIEQPGEYRVRLKVGAQQVGDDPVRFEVRLGERTLGQFDVTAKSQAEQWIETTGEFPPGVHDWQVWFVNAYQDSETKQQRWFWLHEFTLEGPLGGETMLSREDAAELLKKTARRLFRRPLDSSEKRRIDDLVVTAVAAGLTPRLAVRAGLEALLTSPNFLYHSVPRPRRTEGRVADQENALVDGFTLASRLSYFIWSSAPDEVLLQLAEKNQLHAELSSQVDRMLRDPKAAALTQNFAGQWLQLRDLAHTKPDPQSFPDFDARLAADMRRETELVFEEILRENRSVMAFLNADYTYLNARLAEHYQLPVQVDGEEFQRVSLVDSPRRGVVTHGSVLSVTSLPTRTSPVKRGKWVLEQLLATEPPPPPPDIPPLPAMTERSPTTVREQLEAHRSDSQCAACHAMMDPFGLALENYDAVGRWREDLSGQPLDTSGQLVSGEKFSDWLELQQQLVSNHHDELAESFMKQLLTYALGRGVTYRDKPTIAEIVRKSRHSDHGLRDVIVAICESVPFRFMRSAEAAEWQEDSIDVQVAPEREEED